MKKTADYGIMCGRRTLLHNRRLATPLRKGVRQMGNGRGAAVLRILIWFIITLLLMIYISPKAY